MVCLLISRFEGSLNLAAAQPKKLDDMAAARLITGAAGSEMLHQAACWSDRGKTAVHRYGRTGEIARLGRREENDRLGDLGRVRGPAQRCREAQLFQPVAEHADGTVSAGGPRRDGVDTNPVGAEGRRP